MKTKSQRGISPRNSAAKFRISRRNFAAEHGEKVYLSLCIKINWPVFRGVSRRKKMAVTKVFFFCLNLILIWMILYHFKSYQCFVFVSIGIFFIIIVLVPTVTKILLFKFQINFYAFISFQVV